MSKVSQGLIRILHLVGSFREGGTERQAVQLIRLMHESGRAEVHVATLDRSGPLRSQIEALDLCMVPEYRLRSFYDLQMVLQVLRFVKVLRRNRITILHTHGFYSNVFGMVAGTIAHVPVRIASKREMAECRGYWPSRVERLAFRLARVVLANCEAVRRQVAEGGGNTNHVVAIHNALDPLRIVSRVRERERALQIVGLPDTPGLQYVAMVANLHLHAKDHGTFLRAAERVRQAMPQVRFVLAGEGVLLPVMQRMARSLGIGSDVHFVGRCEKIAELLSVADVCVLSSSTEGLPNAVLEYMAAGRPVVATDVGGVSEAITQGKTGFLVRAGDDSSIAERVITILRDPDRARTMGQAAQSEVLSRFSPAVMLCKTMALYEAQLRLAGYGDLVG